MTKRKAAALAADGDKDLPSDVEDRSNAAEDLPLPQFGVVQAGDFDRQSHTDSTHL